MSTVDSFELVRDLESQSMEGLLFGLYLYMFDHQPVPQIHTDTGHIGEDPINQFKLVSSCD